MGKPILRDVRATSGDVTGIMGLVGDRKGTIAISFRENGAMFVFKTLIGDECTKIGPEVVDAIGELTNIIAGGAKAQLEHLDLSVSLPSVITGKGHCIQFPTKVTPICIPFDSEWGPITVEVGLSVPHTMP